MPEDGERAREEPPERRPRYDDYVRPGGQPQEALPRVPAMDAALPPRADTPARSWWRSWLKPLPPSRGQLAGDNWFKRAHRPLLFASGLLLIGCIGVGVAALLLGRKSLPFLGDVVWLAAMLSLVGLTVGVIADLPAVLRSILRKDKTDVPPAAPPRT